MNLDKIFIISLDGDKPELQNKVLENLQKLNFATQTGYEIFPAWNGHEQGVPQGYGVYSKWNLGDNTWIGGREMLFQVKLDVWYLILKYGRGLYLKV